MLSSSDGRGYAGIRRNEHGDGASNCRSCTARELRQAWPRWHIAAAAATARATRLRCFNIAAHMMVYLQNGGGGWSACSKLPQEQWQQDWQEHEDHGIIIMRADSSQLLLA